MHEKILQQLLQHIHSSSCVPSVDQAYVRIYMLRPVRKYTLIYIRLLINVDSDLSKCHFRLTCLLASSDVFVVDVLCTFLNKHVLVV